MMLHPVCPTCGCPDCTIGSDNFGGDLSQFTTTGTPAIVSGYLEMTTGDGVVFTPEAPGGADDAIVVTTTPTATDGDPATFRVEVGRADADNLAFAEFEITSGGGTVQLGYRRGGTDEYLTEAVALPAEADAQDEEFTAKVCWQPGQEVPPGESQFETFSPTIDSGHVAWVGRANCLVEDDTDAVFGFLDEEMAELVVSGFNFGAIPDGSEILGIGVGIRVRTLPLSGLGQIELTSLRIGWNGTPQGDDKGGGQFFPSPVFGYTVLGNVDPEEDLWSTTATLDNLEDGFFISAEFTSTATIDGGVDAFYLTIYYRSADGQTYGKLTAVVGNVLVSTNTDAFGAKTGLRVTAGDWKFNDYVLKLHKDEQGNCPECKIAEASCAADELEDECNTSGFAVHDEPFVGGGDSVSIADGGDATGWGVFAWCFDWRPGLQEGGYVSLRANIDWTGDTATIGINFGFDPVAGHSGCPDETDPHEVPGGNCPGLALFARPQEMYGEEEGLNYAYRSGEAFALIEVEPSPGDKLEIRITCESTGLVARGYVNDVEVFELGDILLPSPLNYRVANTLSGDGGATATWSNIEFEYVPGGA